MQDLQRLQPGGVHVEELRQVQGMKSTAAREVMPRASEEAVHRDYLVVD